MIVWVPAERFNPSKPSVNVYFVPSTLTFLLFSALNTNTNVASEVVVNLTLVDDSIFKHWVSDKPLYLTEPLLVDKLPVISNTLLFFPSVVKLWTTVVPTTGVDEDCVSLDSSWEGASLSAGVDEDGTVEERVAYEVSVGSMEIVNEDPNGENETEQTSQKKVKTTENICCTKSILHFALISILEIHWWGGGKESVLVCWW